MIRRAYEQIKISQDKRALEVGISSLPTAIIFIIQI